MNNIGGFAENFIGDDTQSSKSRKRDKPNFPILGYPRDDTRYSRFMAMADTDAIKKPTIAPIASMPDRGRNPVTVTVLHKDTEAARRATVSTFYVDI